MRADGAKNGSFSDPFPIPESGCVLVLPENKLAEPPRSADLVGIKGQLDYRGHLDEDAYDRFCEEGKLPASSTSDS